MKALLIGNQARFEKFYRSTPFADALEKFYHPTSAPLEELPAEALEAEFLAADAIANVPARLIARMPNLKLIHSEGVAYNQIDCAAARERGIYVCNNKGVNAAAVAEQAILLMLGLLREVVPGHAAVFAGQQIATKERRMLEGITELGDCSIGLIGFGDIAKSVAKFLAPWGCTVYYCAAHRKDAETEQEYHVQWLEQAVLVRQCDIVSLHVPVTPATRGMADEAFFRAMKPTAYFINTARGELVENAALCRALTEGWIAGAGLDTLAPEPVQADNPVLHLPAEAKGQLLLSPHIGGVTTSTFLRSHANIWAAFEAVAAGQRPKNVVNGL